MSENELVFKVTTINVLKSDHSVLLPKKPAFLVPM